MNQMPQSSDREEVLYGTRINGVYTIGGIIHVIRTPEELPYFREGEILVAETIDPAWAEQFSLAKAIIEDSQAVNSSVESIASQYELLPAIVNVEGAMSLRSGDIVTITSNGAIERLCEKRAPDSPMRVSVPAAVAARHHNGIITTPGVVPFTQKTSEDTRDAGDFDQESDQGKTG